MALSHLCTVPASALLQLRCFSAEVQRIQYNSMQPQDIVEHEEKRRVNSLLRREKLIRNLGIIKQLSQLLLTPDTQEPCALQSQVMALPRATHTAEAEGWREVNWAMNISGGAGWGSAAGR